MGQHDELLGHERANVIVESWRRKFYLKASRQDLNHAGSKVGIVEVPSLFPRRYPVEHASGDSEDPRTDLDPRRRQQEESGI